MRILFLAMNLGSGGAERQMVTVASLLKDRGYDVEFVCYSEGDFYLNLLEERSIPVYWKIEPNYFKRMLSIRHFIRHGKYDAVISFLETPNFLNNFSALGGRTWKVITGERSAQEKTFESVKSKVFCWFQRFSDIIVCNSENAKQMWVKHFPQYGKKLRVIYNTVTLQSITSRYIAKRNNKLHIVVAASYQYLKNPIGLVNALSLMSVEERDKVYIDWYGKKEVLTGDTRAYDEARELIEKNRLESVINLHGNSKEIHDRMNEADVVALFSRVEGLPNVICEGMTIGKPIIMTKISDYRVLVDDSNGFLCDWNQPESIKEVIVAAANQNVQQLIYKGEQSKQKAMELFKKESVLKSWIELLK